MFEVVHKAAHCLLAPMDTVKRTFSWFITRNNEATDVPAGGPGTSVPTTVLSHNDPTPTEKKTSYSALNTDARTCRDVITEYGYDYLI